MALSVRPAKDLDLVDSGEPARLRNAEQVKLGFEKPHWYLQGRSFNIRIRAETVRYFLGDAKCERILDIGCGDGSVSVPLLGTQNYLTLLDMSETMLNIARSRIPATLASRVNVINDQFTQATLKPGSYDLIICLGVLAYIDDTRSFLEKILSTLEPGGDLIIECTDSSHPVTKLGQVIGAARSLLSPPRFSVTPHASSEVIGVLTQLGFILRGAFRYSLPPPGIRRILSQSFHYKSIRMLYGSPEHNRIPWLGSECIYHFRKQLD